MSDPELGAETKVFQRRSPLALVLVLLPAFTTLFFLIGLSNFATHDPGRGFEPTKESESRNLKFFIGTTVAEIVGVGIYVLVRRRMKGYRLALHENGFLWRSRKVLWKDIAGAKHVAHGGLEILTVSMHSGDPFELHGHLVGSELTSPLIQALKERGLMKA